MVYKVVGVIWLFLLLSWLHANGWQRGAELTLGFVVVAGIAVAHVFWLLVLAWLAWPRNHKQ